MLELLPVPSKVKLANVLAPDIVIRVEVIITLLYVNPPPENVWLSLAVMLIVEVPALNVRLVVVVAVHIPTPPAPDNKFIVAAPIVRLLVVDPDMVIPPIVRVLPFKSRDPAVRVMLAAAVCAIVTLDDSIQEPPAPLKVNEAQFLPPKSIVC